MMFLPSGPKDSRVYLDGKIEGADKVDPALHHFVGMFRAPFESPRADIYCSCGSIVQTVQDSREHWQLGHFDIATYETKK